MTSKSSKTQTSWPDLLKHIFDSLQKVTWMDFLNFRILISTTMLGIGGGILRNTIDAVGLNKNYFIGFALIFSFIISLLISLLLKGKKTVRKRKIILMISVGLIMLSVFFCFCFFESYNRLTFTFSEGFPKDKSEKAEEPSINYLSGIYYSKNAKIKREDLKEIEGVYPTDSALLMRFGGMKGFSKVWDQDSLTQSSRKLFITYIALVVLLTGVISLLSEILFAYKRK